MRKSVLVCVFVALFAIAFYPAASSAEVNINIGLPLLPAPPFLLPVPGAYIYFVPDIDVDVFFYQDYWYRPHGNRWYRARHYNGPWIIVPGPRVPRPLHGLPPGWRSTPPGHDKVPYGQVKKNWRTWEKQKRWDKREDKRDRREDRRDRREDRRDDRMERKGGGWGR